MSLRRLFPTQIYAAALPKGKARVWIPRLIQDAERFRAIDDGGKKWSKENYAAGYTSYSSVADLPYRSSNFGALRDWIDGHVRAYAKALEFDLRGGKLEMSTCWVNIMEKHCHHSFHLHPLSAISGTFYLQTPKGSGKFKMEDPRLGLFMGSPPRKANAREENRRFAEFAPTPGSLVLFESWLKHEVAANRSHEERISVSFNYDWVR